MKLSKTLLVFPLVAAISGCAIRPTPEDVTKLSTEDIVSHIRCEAFVSVLNEVISLLDRVPENNRSRISASRLKETLDQRVREGKIFITPEERDIFKTIAQMLAKDLKSNYLTEDDKIIARQFIYAENFGKWVISYNFKFEITEDNNAAGGSSFRLPITNGTFTIGLDAGVDRQRESEQNFLMADTFETLLKNWNCNNYQNNPNHVYPITGDIGIADVMDTFFDLVINQGTVANFTDRITFTTKLTSSVKPEISITPVSNNFVLTSASLTLANNRTDVHQVTIALVDPKQAATYKDPISGALKILERRESIDAAVLLRDRRP